MASDEVGHVSRLRANVLGIICVVMALSAAGGLVLLLALKAPSLLAASARHRLVSGARLGMSRSDVIAHLGQPSFVVHSRAMFTATNAYKPVPTYTVEKEVLEYYSYIWKLYVYIDKTGRVSHIVVART